MPPFSILGGDSMYHFEDFEKLAVGDWVQFRDQKGYVLRGYITKLGQVWAIVYITSEGLSKGNPHQVERAELHRLKDDIEGMDKSGLIDVALITGDKDWFNQLIQEEKEDEATL